MDDTVEQVTRTRETTETVFTGSITENHGIAVIVSAPPGRELTVSQAREIANAISRLADKAERTTSAEDAESHHSALPTTR